MSRKGLVRRIVSAWCLAVLALTAAAVPLTAQAGAPPASAAEMRKEIVPLKYIDAADMLLMLEPYRGREGSISLSRDSSRNAVLFLRDTAPNMDKMLAFIKQMDVRPAEILFTVQLISGTSAGEAKADPLLAADPALQDLRKLMGFRSFALIGAGAVRTSERETAQVTLGRSGEYALALKPRLIKDAKEERIQAQIRFGYASNGQAPPPLFESTVILKPGEKTVVGVSKPHDPSSPGTDQDRGLILLLSATLIK